MTEAQDIDWAQYEAPTVRVTMSPAVDITGATHRLNVRNQESGELVDYWTETVESSSLGIFTFDPTSAETGVITPGDYDYDIWRTDAGNEKRLVWGTLTVSRQQWQ